MDDKGRSGSSPVESDRFFEEARRPPSQGSVRPPSVPTPPQPSPGLLGEPSQLAWFRSRAETFGDLAAEMAGEGLEGMAFGAARKAAHYALLVRGAREQAAADVKPYRPSNGREGDAFRERWCFRCRRERGDARCEILYRSFWYAIDDLRYPKEWVWSPEHGFDTARCTAFEASR